MRKIKYGLLVLFLIIPLLFVTNNQAQAQIGQIWETIVGDPDAPEESGIDPGTGGGRNFPKCNELNSAPVKCLKDDFNVVVSGYSGYTPSQQDRIDVYNVLWANSQATNWRRLLMRGGELTIRYGNSGGSFASSASLVTCGRCASLTAVSKRYLLTHELGHIIGLRNLQLYRSFDANTMAGRDPGCYEYNACGLRRGSFLKSYVLRYFCPSYANSCVSILHNNESFAEATANYLRKASVNRTGGWCAKTISDFKNQCNDTYSWMFKNVYNGYEFY